MGLKEDFDSARAAGQPAIQVGQQEAPKPIPSINNSAVLEDNPPVTPQKEKLSVLDLLKAKQEADAKKPSVAVPAVAPTGKAASQVKVPSTQQVATQSKIGKKPWREKDGTWHVELPYSLPNGDLVVDEILPSAGDPNVVPNVARIMSNHLPKITKLADGSQVYPYLMECSCGTQARTYTQDEAISAMGAHLSKRVQTESPK